MLALHPTINIFRLSGDMIHLASKFIIIHRIFGMRSCRGLSLKTQSVYLLVFVTRYLDLFTTWISLYNTLMKIFYIISSAYIIYLAVEKFRPVDEEESTDTFPIQYILLPCFCLSFIVSYRFTAMEILWSLSILLEAVAILPQLHMLKRTGQAEALTRYYVISLGTYRALYILNWIYRWHYEHVYDPIANVSGFVQTCLNFYFIYVYFRKYPREADIEFYAETAPPPPLLAEDPVSANGPAPFKEPSAVHGLISVDSNSPIHGASAVDDLSPVDDPSSKALDLEPPTISAAPGSIAESNVTETES